MRTLRIRPDEHSRPRPRCRIERLDFGDGVYCGATATLFLHYSEGQSGPFVTIPACSRCAEESAREAAADGYAVTDDSATTK